MMRKKCDECGGKIVEREVDFSLFGVNIGQFPAEVCTKCGEKVFTEEISAEIDKMKAEEQDAFSKFSEFRKKFHEVNSQLKEKLKALNEIKSQLDKIDSERKEKRKQEQESFFKSKEEEINQKIKKRQKLTTEDLLIFQKFGKD